jgi:hypothetical protein
MSHIPVLLFITSTLYPLYWFLCTHPTPKIVKTEPDSLDAGDDRLGTGLRLGLRAGAKPDE